MTAHHIFYISKHIMPYLNTFVNVFGTYFVTPADTTGKEDTNVSESSAFQVSESEASTEESAESSKEETTVSESPVSQASERKTSKVSSVQSNTDEATVSESPVSQTSDRKTSKVSSAESSKEETTVSENTASPVTYSPAYAELFGGGFLLKYSNLYSINKLSPCVPRL